MSFVHASPLCPLGRHARTNTHTPMAIHVCAQVETNLTCTRAEKHDMQRSVIEGLIYRSKGETVSSLMNIDHKGFVRYQSISEVNTTST